MSSVQKSRTQRSPQRKQQRPKDEISGLARPQLIPLVKPTERQGNWVRGRPAFKANRRGGSEGAKGDCSERGAGLFSCLVSAQVALELAQLYLLQGQLDLCEQRCGPLLQMEQTQERAAVVGAACHAAHRPEGPRDRFLII